MQKPRSGSCFTVMVALSFERGGRTSCIVPKPPREPSTMLHQDVPQSSEVCRNSGSSLASPIHHRLRPKEGPHAPYCAYEPRPLDAEATRRPDCDHHYQKLNIVEIPSEANRRSPMRPRPSGRGAHVSDQNVHKVRTWWDDMTKMFPHQAANISLVPAHHRLRALQKAG